MTDVEGAALEQDWRQAHRRLESLERAPFEGRVADVEAWERQLHFQRLRVLDLDRLMLAHRMSEDDSA